MFKSEAEFIKQIASATMVDCAGPYDGYGNMDEDMAHASLKQIRGRMEALIAFINALDYPPIAASAQPSVAAILLEKER